jgi:hypothetical protein
MTISGSENDGVPERCNGFARHLPVDQSGPEIRPVLGLVGNKRLPGFRVLWVD